MNASRCIATSPNTISSAVSMVYPASGIYNTGNCNGSAHLVCTINRGLENGGITMISGKSFSFTGQFTTMTPELARESVLNKGGSVPSSVTKTLDYLVVGNQDSPLINNGNGKRGKKFSKAEELNERGANIEIITEGNFIDMLQAQAQE
jgi:NAD-dependent DNA ligase